MKKYYGVGFFIFVLLIMIGLNIGYRKSYQQTLNKKEIEYRTEEKSISTKGNACKNNGYYIKDLNGYVVVYFSDEETLFELTTIQTKSLPEAVQQEIQNGKYVKTVKELYGFLENYSS